ncbi:MAG TPA: outer membrane lipoprotein-sorting protein [bacterium]|nr:outer membrane lipoprotein-sorting protein [bacterium]
MKKIMFFMILILPALLFSQTESADEILKRVDENMLSDSKIIVFKMIIHGRRGERTVEAKSWQRNTDDSFTEYLAPPREKGTKMLKLGDQLWTYSPQTDRTILISGHMLRQSVMGSDLSYEDLMEDQRLHQLYQPTLIGEDTQLGRQCWLLELSASQKNIAYYSRKIWVDKERFLPLREERYAKSGRLLKTTEVKEMMLSGDRWVAKKVVFKDELKTGGGTEFTVESIDFDVPIQDHFFSKAALKK